MFLSSYPLLTCHDTSAQVHICCPELINPQLITPLFRELTLPWHNFTLRAIVSLTLTSSKCCSWLKPSKCYFIMPGSTLRQTTEILSFKFIHAILLYLKRKCKTKHRISVKTKSFVLVGVTFQVKNRPVHIMALVVAPIAPVVMYFIGVQVTCRFSFLEYFFPVPFHEATFIYVG